MLGEHCESAVHDSLGASEAAAVVDWVGVVDCCVGVNEVEVGNRDMAVGDCS